MIAELDGPAVALADVERLRMQQYHAWHAAEPTCCGASAAPQTQGARMTPRSTSQSTLLRFAT